MNNIKHKFKTQILYYDCKTKTESHLIYIQYNLSIYNFGNGYSKCFFKTFWESNYLQWEILIVSQKVCNMYIHFTHEALHNDNR